jgi:large subunit ribosomal protein L15
MQSKRKKRSRIRAAKPTAGHGHKKKNRGAGHRGGRGKSGAGKRGDAKLMKVTKGVRDLGKHGFTSRIPDKKIMNLAFLQTKLDSLITEGKASLDKGTYVVDLEKLKVDKLLSKGQVYKKLHIKVPAATARAVKKVEEAGGKVVQNKGNK